MEAAPRARTTDFGKGGVAADIFGHRAHKVGYGKVGKAMRQEKNRISRGNGRGLLRRRSHRFYTTAERRGTAMKKGI